MTTLSAYTMAQMGININWVLASTLITAVLVLPMRPGHVFVLSWMGWRPKQRPDRVPASISLRLVGENEPKIPKRDFNHSKTEEVSDH